MYLYNTQKTMCYLVESFHPIIPMEIISVQPNHDMSSSRQIKSLESMHNAV